MVHPLRDKAAVSGIGETAYTRGTTKSGLALQLEASLKALDDAGVAHQVGRGVLLAGQGVADPGAGVGIGTGSLGHGVAASLAHRVRPDPTARLVTPMPPGPPRRVAGGRQVERESPPGPRPIG